MNRFPSHDVSLVAFESGQGLTLAALSFTALKRGANQQLELRAKLFAIIPWQYG
jgi:hypothetical protein